MPSWFGSKSSTGDVRKKKGLENIFDGAKRRFKQLREESRSPSGSRLSLDSGSDAGSGAWLGSRSPASVPAGYSTSFDEASQAQPHPLPCAPPLASGRTESGKNVYLLSSPSMPLPSPDQLLIAGEVTEGDGGVVSGYGTGSTSSVSSQESMSVMDSIVHFSTSSHGDAVDGFEHNGFGITQASLSPRYNNMSPREFSHPSSPLLNQHVSSSPRRAFSGNYGDALALVRNGMAGSSDSPARSPRRAHSSDPAFGNVLRGKISPERSPVPSPRGRSPGPSSRIQSAAVSPLHPRACGGGPDSPNGWHENGNLQAHPLPLPPSSLPGSCPPVSAASPSIPRSPGRVDRPVNLGTGWRKGSLLGSGTFGQVYTGFHSETGQSCAIKEVVIIPDNEKSFESAKQLAQEISLLSQMKHSNIVQYYGSEMIEDRLYIYLELMSNGSIHKLIQQYGPLEESCIRVYTRQILSGLSYLHGKNTVHRDIKGANILVDKGGVVKLADFGMAKHISAQSFPLSFKGSPYWMAPEVIRNSNGYDFAVDIWSLGCTVLEMATGKPPWSQFEGVAAMFKIGNSKETPFIPGFLSDEGKLFLRSCLQRDPRNRPTAAQLLEHPFVNNVVHQTCISDAQVSASEIVTPGMQALNFIDSRCHSRSVSQVGNISVPLSPSASPQLQPRTPQHNYGALSPSAASTPILNSGCSTPLTGGNGCSPFHGNGMLKASPLHEASVKSPKSPKSPNGIYGSSARMHTDPRIESGWATSRTPDGSPRRQDFPSWDEDNLTTAVGRIPGGEEAQRLYGGSVLRAEHPSQRFLRSPQQYNALPLQPGSPSLLGRANSHDLGYFAEAGSAHRRA